MVGSEFIFFVTFYLDISSTVADRNDDSYAGRIVASANLF